MSLLDHNPVTEPMIQVMAPDGTVVRPELMPTWDRAKLREIYELMVYMRMADAKLVSLQRQGRCGTYPSIEGQEAVQVGSGLMIEKSDWIFPAFREFGICLMHGIPLEKMYVYWMGNEWGSNVPASVAPVSIPVGSHPTHAVGYAWAMKLQKKSHISVSYFGDGATSEGAFYEAMNFAGVFKVPTIFICQNNQWAISVPRSKQTAAKTLAQKAIGCGIPGVQVDGNDLFGMAAVMGEAVARARRGEGATFIEAVTYRFGNHTTSDDAGKYREKSDVEAWRPRDPMIRLKAYLTSQAVIDAAFEEEIKTRAEEKIRAAVAAAEAHPATTIDDIFDFMYANVTPALAEQKEYLKPFFPNGTAQ